MIDLRGRIWSDLLTGLNAGQHLAVDAVVAFVDGELGASAHERAAMHVTGCASCAAEVTAQRQARSAVRTAAEPAAPSSLLAMLRSIPQTAELVARVPDAVAVTGDGVIVSMSPNVPTPLGSTAPLGSAAPLGSTAPLGTSTPRGATAGGPRPGTARQGAGTVMSGLVLGALIMVTPAGTPVPLEPTPGTPVPTIPAVDGSAPAISPVDGLVPAVPTGDLSPVQLELSGASVFDQATTGPGGLR